MTVRVAINGFGRIGRNVLRAIAEAGPHRHRGRRHQRSRPGRDQRASAALRQRAWPLPRRGHGQGRHHQRRQRRHQGHRHQGSRHAAVEGPRRRHRARMHRHLHRQGQGLDASDRRRQARAGVGAGRRRRSDRRLRRQSRQADQGSQGRLQRLLHHQLPGAGRQGAQRRHRHRQGLHDDDPRLYRRPADARYACTRISIAAAPPRCR